MRGIWTALITPFNSNNEIDFPAFKKILHHQIEAGVAGVIPGGTTGESQALSLNEKKLLISYTLSELKGRGVQVVAGTGNASTAETIELSRWASNQGVDGVLIVTPFYSKPSQLGLEQHMIAIADAVDCEVIPYNVPSRTGVCLTAETITRLAKHPRIHSLKEATGQINFTSEILDSLSNKKLSLDILSGDDATFLGLLAVGAAGAISVASNLFPRAMVEMQNAAEQGKRAEALKIHNHYYPLFRDLFIESNPVPIKFAMEFAGWCQSRVRLPLSPLLPANAEKLEASLKKCEILIRKKEHTE
jgi:4-hydroxy-tetrahydrodipicolinate synthase